MTYEVFPPLFWEVLLQVFIYGFFFFGVLGTILLIGTDLFRNEIYALQLWIRSLFRRKQ